MAAKKAAAAAVSEAQAEVRVRVRVKSGHSHDLHYRSGNVFGKQAAEFSVLPWQAKSYEADAVLIVERLDAAE